MSHCFFITGTDTGIGKTYAATQLLRSASAQGLSALGLKPVSAGCEDRNGVSVNQDAWELLEASTIKPAYSDVNPVALQEAIAPHIAAEREGKIISASPLAEHCRKQSVAAEFTVIEGAGGWQVPLNDSESMADLAVSIGAPVILIVGIRLGCINHALLTAAAIEQSGLKLAGWIANCIDVQMPAMQENINTLETRLQTQCIATLPWQPSPEKIAIINIDSLVAT